MANKPIIQYIELQDEAQVVVFTKNGRVFFDLDSLVSQYTPSMVSRSIAAATSGDEPLRAYVQGQIDLLLNISEQIDIINLNVSEAISGL